MHLFQISHQSRMTRSKAVVPSRLPSWQQPRHVLFTLFPFEILQDLKRPKPLRILTTPWRASDRLQMLKKTQPTAELPPSLPPSPPQSPVETFSEPCCNAETGSKLSISFTFLPRLTLPAPNQLPALLPSKKRSRQTKKEDSKSNPASSSTSLDKKTKRVLNPGRRANCGPPAGLGPCFACKRKNTPYWRHSWLNNKILCNACGIRFVKYELYCAGCFHVPCKEDGGKHTKVCARCGRSDMVVAKRA